MGLPALMQKYMRSVGLGRTVRWLCQQSFILGRNCVLALVLFTATHFFLPPFLPCLLLPFRPLLRHLSTPKKGYDIILEWALRYIALFLSFLLSAALLPPEKLHSDDRGITFVRIWIHNFTSIHMGHWVNVKLYGSMVC